MIRSIYRARPVILIAAGAVVAGCSTFKDQLLSPQQPGVIGPEAVASPTAADALRQGAISRLKTATVGGTGNGGAAVMTMGGLLADEWKSGDTFSQRVETDQRTIQGDNGEVAPFYQAEQRARGSAKDAIEALRKFLPEPAANIAQMYWAMGLAELQLSEQFCNGVPYGEINDGVPTYTNPLTNAEGFALALAHIDSGLALATATDTFAVNTKYNLLAAKARILVNQGKFAEAATVAAGVPTAYRWYMTFSTTTGDNPIWSYNNSQKRWVVGDSFDTQGLIKNALPFASAKDPRVPVAGTSVNSSLKLAFDNGTQFVNQTLFNRSDWIPIVSGIDARLIEAEAKLNANDIAGMMTILNALRTSTPRPVIGVTTIPAMATLATPANQADATSLLFREKAFWTFGRGQRLADLRRLVRQYGRTDDQVFPTGTYFKGGKYGTDENFPVPSSEQVNPLFTGCLDRKA